MSEIDEEFGRYLDSLVEPIEPEWVIGWVARRRRRRAAIVTGCGLALAAITGVVGYAIHSSPSQPVRVGTVAGASSTSASSTTTSTTVATTPTTHGPTIGVSPPTSPGTTTAVPTTVAGSSDPHATDFTGTLTVGATTIHVGDTIPVDWSIHNATDHPIMPFYLRFDTRSVQLPNTHDVAAICVKLTPDGQPQSILSMASDHGLWFASPNAWMQPGDSAQLSDTYTATAADVGTLTCEVAVLGTERGWLDLSLDARMPAIPPITLTVLPTDTTTTTTPTTTTTTTSVSTTT